MKRGFFYILIIVLALLFANVKEEYVATVGREFTDDEERVEAFIKDLYKNGVNFTEVEGDSTVYKKRYYCSNVCIDLLNDGSIRYLSDENDADNEDKLLKWLYKGGAEIMSETEVNGFLYRKLKSSNFKCDLCIARTDGRVVAAKITFTS